MDIIIYAVIAIVVLSRLWSVLGRRNEGDKERPNPFALTPPTAKKQDDETLAIAGPNIELPPVFRPLKSAPDSLAGGLEQIKTLDPSFDEKQFLQGARSAFTMILDEFAKGDLARSTRLLGPHVLPHFQAAIAERRQAGQTMENKIQRFKDVETAAARVDGSCTTITVRFVTEQENILRDATGKIISGDEGKTEEITDLWTFTRDTKSSDPNWLLVETKS